LLTHFLADGNNSPQLKDKRVLVVGGGNSACDMYVRYHRVLFITRSQSHTPVVS
jgi:cation diffusion facilitator CzcD-associated flavoprotein CzcO